MALDFTKGVHEIAHGLAEKTDVFKTDKGYSFKYDDKTYTLDEFKEFITDKISDVRRTNKKFDDPNAKRTVFKAIVDVILFILIQIKKVFLDEKALKPTDETKKGKK